MENKRGQMWNIIILIGGLILLTLIVAGGMIGWGVVKSATDVIIPEFNAIGDIGAGGNVSEYTEMTTTPLSSIIDNFALLMGLIYIVGIMGLLSYSFIFRDNLNGWVVALFFVSIMLLIVMCIAVSQFYEEFYLGQDELGTLLRSASVASFLIINSPVIMTIIAFLSGIILFSGNKDLGYNVYGV